MKKAIVLFLILTLTVPMLCFSASAEEYTNPYDARNVPDEVAELLPDHENAEMIYQFFIISPVYSGGIGSVDSIEQKLVDGTPYYAVVTSDRINYYKIKNGEAVKWTWSAATRISNELSTLDAIYAVSPDICIESVYCFLDFYYAISDSTILYKTNLGDYVYFKTEQTQPMLMTVRRYDEYCVAWAEYSREMLETKGGLLGGRYVLHIDFSAYDWTSPNFDPDAPLPLEKEAEEPEFPWLIVGISAAVLIAVVVTTVLIIRKKKTKTAPEETEPIPEET